MRQLDLSGLNLLQASTQRMAGLLRDAREAAEIEQIAADLVTGYLAKHPDEELDAEQRHIAVEVAEDCVLDTPRSRSWRVIWELPREERAAEYLRQFGEDDLSAEAVMRAFSE